MLVTSWEQVYLVLGSLALAIIVQKIGQQALKYFPVIQRLNLPTSVIAGLFFAAIITLIKTYWDIQLNLSMPLRDFLLVVFFCCVGLSVRFREILSGGRALLVLCLLAILLVLAQNLVGVLVMAAFGEHPLFGLLSGSIPFVGGFGSSLAWGTEWESQGLTLAKELAFACSTLGLIAGGLLAGPMASYLIHKEKLGFVENPDRLKERAAAETFSQTQSHCTYAHFIKLALVILACVLIGDLILSFLNLIGMHLPRFLVVMLVGLIVVNLFPQKSSWVDPEVGESVSTFCFNSFIILSLIGMHVFMLSNLIAPVLIILVLQIILTVLFSSMVVFRLMGKDYEAAVISSGVVGFGLSSLAVAVATVQTISNNYGAAPRALLLTSLVGAALIDLANNLLIIILAKLPLFAI